MHFTEDKFYCHYLFTGKIESADTVGMGVGPEGAPKFGLVGLFFASARKFYSKSTEVPIL
jgi:hypothetical protein